MSFDGESFGQAVYKYRTGMIIGGLIGLFTGGPFGAVFGAAIGFFVNKSLRKAVIKNNPQQLFFRATFMVMGRIAKADGQVSKNEIQFAEAVMQQMRLTGEKRAEAIDLFNQGKSPECDLDEVLRPLALLLRSSGSLRLMFVEIQLQAALADGEVSVAEQQVIIEVCRKLYFSDREIQMLLERLQVAQEFAKNGGRSHYQGQAGQSQGPSLEQCYATLGVSSESSDADVKKAWRKLISQNHPDKLVSKGLPEEMIELAKEKTQEIQSAYETIKAARGMR